MILNLGIRLEIKGECVCFRHAVLAAIAGQNVTMEIADKDDSYDFRYWYCKRCEEERAKKKEANILFQSEEEEL